MTFMQSIKTCLSKYVDFNGRASRSEYWWFFLFVLMLIWAAEIVFGEESILVLLVELALMLPYIAAAARRLHDTGRSGWHQLWGLTIIGIIWVIYCCASAKGTNETNQYGEPLSSDITELDV